MDAPEASAALARWLALRAQALPLHEALPGVRIGGAFDACLALWQGEDLIVHALLADPAPDPAEAGQAAEALRHALEQAAGSVPGRVRACVHVLCDDARRAQDLREALLGQADGHFIAKVLVGRSVLCLNPARADYSGRGTVEPSPEALLAVLRQPQSLPSLEDAEAWRLRRQREQRGLQRLLKPGPAPLTWILIALNGAAFLAQLLAAGRLQEQGLGPGAAEFAALIELGANQGWAQLRDSGQWWRLMAAAFLHGGPLHLFMNMAALYSLGSLSERVLGPVRLAAFYLAAALISSVTSALFLPSGVPSVGASGAILGLCGLLLAPSLRRHPGFPQALAERLKLWLWRPTLLLFGLGLAFKALDLPLQFDNAAHLGGLLSGLALGYLYPSFLVPPKHRQG